MIDIFGQLIFRLLQYYEYVLFSALTWLLVFVIVRLCISHRGRFLLYFSSRCNYPIKAHLSELYSTKI